MEQLGEISEVNIRGIEEKEVKVNLNVHKLTALQLSFRDVENAIRNRNVAMSAGNLKTDSLEISIKVDDQFQSVDELGELIIKDEKQEIVYLKNVLSEPVTLAPKEKESYARFDGNNVVVLEVIKGSGENIIEASNKINDILEKSKESGQIPNDVRFTITLDQSDDTIAQVANLENSIYSGVILVVLVLLFPATLVIALQAMEAHLCCVTTCQLVKNLLRIRIKSFDRRI
jgi:multidrug efflux pump subunit AcrB